MNAIDKADDYILKIKIQNNNIVSLMKANDIENVAELSRLTKISQTILGNLINMKNSPFSNAIQKRHTSMPWREPVLRLADFFGVLPDELFNWQQMYNPVKSNKAEKTISEDNLHALLPDFEDIYLLEDKVHDEEKLKFLESTLASLTPREQSVIKMRFGLNNEEPKTLKEIGKIFDVQQERVRQIEAEAIRKLRQPNRADILKQAFDLQEQDQKKIRDAQITFVLTAKQKEILRSATKVGVAIEEHNIHEKSAYEWLNKQREKERRRKEKESFDIMKMEKKAREEAADRERREYWMKQDELNALHKETDLIIKEAICEYFSNQDFVVTYYYKDTDKVYCVRLLKGGIAKYIVLSFCRIDDFNDRNSLTRERMDEIMQTESVIAGEKRE